MLAKHLVHGVRIVGRIEPGLRVDTVRVVVWRIDQPVGDGEPHGRVAHPFQVAAPPVVIATIFAGALDDDQPARGAFQDGVAHSLGAQPPVGGAAVAPAGPVGFVGQVGADDGGVGTVAVGQQLPVLDDPRLGRRGRIPEAVAVRAVAGLGAVVVEDDPQPDLAGMVDDPVKDLEHVEAAQIGVQRIVDPVGHAARQQRLIAVGQPNGIEAQLHHLIEHGVIVAGPEAMRDIGGGFAAEPVHRVDLHRGAGGVDDLVAAGGEVAGRRRVADRHRRRRVGLAQLQAETLRPFSQVVGQDGDGDGAAGLARREGQATGCGGVVAAGHRRAVHRRVINRHRRGRRLVQPHRQAQGRGACQRFGDGRVGNAEAGRCDGSGNEGELPRLARRLEAEPRHAVGCHGPVIVQVADDVAATLMADDARVPKIGQGEGRIERYCPAIKRGGASCHGDVGDEATRPTLADSRIDGLRHVKKALSKLTLRAFL